MDSLTIRPARPQDADAIAGFQVAMAAETEDRRLAPEVVGPGVRAVLSDESRGRYIVGEHEGRVIASLLLTQEWSDWRNGWFWWIQSVFVVPELRRQGVYAALYGEVLRRAREEPAVCGLRLYVEDTNAAARAVYQRLGMAQTSYRLYEISLEGENGA